MQLVSNGWLTKNATAAIGMNLTYIDRGLDFFLV
jgi:hypothetical protein